MVLYTIEYASSRDHLFIKKAQSSFLASYISAQDLVTACPLRGSASSVSSESSTLLSCVIQNIICWSSSRCCGLSADLHTHFRDLPRAEGRSLLSHST